MCGIAGVLVGIAAPPIDSEGIGRGFLERLAHRGPDGQGLLVLRGDVPVLLPDGRGAPPARLLLAHRRLAIVDLTDAGRQPFGSGDGRAWIVFNGEVYNHKELRAELEALGDTFRSRTDTEVILAAYRRFGPDCVRRFVGMFAFAIADLDRRRLFLARDFFGIKPLYWTRALGGLAFASEIKALLGLPDVKARAEPQRLHDYLRWGLTDHGAGTMFEGIHQLPSASFAELSLDAPSHPAPTVYWTPPRAAPSIAAADAPERVRRALTESVTLHLRADVPVGACLSGGIDSSSLVSLVRAVGGPSLELHTFGYASDDPVTGEERFMDVVASAVGSVAHKVRLEPEEVARDLDRLVLSQDEPFGSSSIYAQSRLFALIHAAGIKVVLDGQGADELFAGYGGHRAARLASLVARGRLVAASRLASAATRGTVPTAAHFLLPGRFVAGLRRLAGRPTIPRWMRGAWFKERGVVPRTLYEPDTGDAFRDCLRRDLMETTVPMLLRYEDRSSMAHSVESRVPFLIPALAELSAALPHDLLVAPDGTTKVALRRAMRGTVPDVILDRQDKVGFATPEGRWLEALAPWVERTLASDAAARIGAIDASVLRDEWRRVLARGADFTVWRWLNLIRWAELRQVSF